MTAAAIHYNCQVGMREGQDRVNPLLLHGSAGLWDEIVCLALPATIVMGFALALLRQERRHPAASGATAPTTDADEPAAQAATSVRDDERA